jgi:Carboxypeptidase regulatory-like domain/TonB dependent receptor
MNFPLISLFLLASSAYAQATLGQASLGGVVRDASGGVAPGTSIVLTDIARGINRNAVTNESGVFQFPGVSPGAYSVRISKTGFQTEEIKNLALAVGQAESLEIELKIGEVSSVVVVSADSVPQLETESNVIGTVVDSSRVQDLPLNGRSYLQLALISAGSLQSNSRSDAISAQTGRGDNVVLLGGNAGSSTGYLIDGIAVRGGRLGESAINLSPSAIDQFKVQMSFFMPDQGPNPGLVNLTTKGGGNRFHGELFEFLRNGNMDARNFFSPGAENLHRNQFGGAVGGPIRKDHTWFFANWESLREVTGFTSSGYAPTAAMFGGNFTALTAVIYDPQSYNSATGTRTAFPGQIVPTQRINSVAKALLDYYLSGSSLAQKPSNIFANPRRTNSDDQLGVRVDHAFSSKQQGFVRYLRERGDLVSPGLMPYTGSDYPLEADFATAQHTWTVTPALVNVLRLGFVRNTIFSGNEGAVLGSVLPKLGIDNTLDTRGISGISMSGYAGFGRSAGDLGNMDNSYQLDDGMYWTRGSHALQFGASLRYHRTRQQNSNANALGSLTFQSQFTAQLVKNAQGQTTPQAGAGDSFADFLLGLPATGQVVGLPLLPYRFTQFNPYLQDTWKVTRSLTINYGIAWFIASNPHPVGWAEKLPHSFDYQTGLLRYAVLGQVDPRILEMNWHNFTPRLGLAWRATKNTVIRAGVGTYFADTKLIEAQFAMVAPPFNTPLTITNVATNPTPVYALGQNVFPAPPALPLNDAYAASLPNGTTAFLLKPSKASPYVNQWNFSIQHSLGQGEIVEAVYMGSSSHHLQNRYEGDQCLVTADLRCDTATKPWPRYASLLTADFNGNGSYNALIARYIHQGRGGLNARLEYTFGKAIDDTFEGGSNESQISSCRRCDRGNASFDQKQRLVSSLIYRLPVGKGQRFGANMPEAVNILAGGWNVSSIATFATGVPFDVTGPNTTGYNNITHRANRLCDGRPADQSAVRDHGMQWLTPACFASQATGFYGNAARNVLYGPGINNWDLGVEKNFAIPLGEATRLQFRGELFNAFNHAQFNAPNSATTSANFGLIGGARAPRLVQFALRLMF